MGDKIQWDKYVGENSTLYLPQSTNDSIRELLVPETYCIDDDPDLIGVGSLATGLEIGHLEASHVHLRNGYAIKSAPFINEDRFLDWLKANLMLENALKIAGELYPEGSTIQTNGQVYTVRTPKYMGALSLHRNPFASITAMSYEGKVVSESNQLFKDNNKSLKEIVKFAMGFIYPQVFIEDMDHWHGNWILNPETNEFIRIDLLGLTNQPIRDPRFAPHCG